MKATFAGRDARTGTKFEAGVEIEKMVGGYGLVFTHEPSAHIFGLAYNGTNGSMSKLHGSGMVIIFGTNGDGRMAQFSAANASELLAFASRFETVTRHDESVVANRDYSIEMAQEDFSAVTARELVM